MYILYIMINLYNMYQHIYINNKSEKNVFYICYSICIVIFPGYFVCFFSIILS